MQRYLQSGFQLIVFFVLLWASTSEISRAQATSSVTRLHAWEEHQALGQESPFRDLKWRALGPLQAGAKIEAIAVPPGNHGIIYVGVGSGNIWKTVNNGVSWTPIFENESTFSIGDLAISNSDPDIIWAGTGETQPRPWGYAYSGTGVFRSLDGGNNWSNMGLSETHHIGKVLIHPSNPNIVFVAAIGHFNTQNDERGVFRTSDGGSTWEKVLFLGNDTGAIDLVMNPSDPSVIYAAMWQRNSGSDGESGEKSGIYRSLDGGDTWIRLENGLPKGQLGRSGLDISQSNPDVIYTFIDNRSQAASVEDDALIGGEVYRSNNRGDTWENVSKENMSIIFGALGWKFADIRVSPANENELFVLGVKAYHSSDGGKTYARIGENIVRVHDTRGEVMHLDQHEIWIDPLNPGRVLLGNDGGLFQSYDGGDSWLHHNNIPAAEFYAVSFDNSSPFNVYGGTQDNAALFGPSDTELDGSRVAGSITDPWENVYLDRWTGGDSFDTLVDPTSEGVVYYEHQHGGLMRIDVNGESVLTGGRSAESIRPRAPEGEVAWLFGWFAPLTLSHHDPRTLFMGANVLLRSTDRGDNWRAISPDLADSSGGEKAPIPYGGITDIAESFSDPNLIWVGTEGGTVWFGDLSTEIWSKRDKNLPAKWVSTLIASQHDPRSLYVSMTGYREDDFSAYLYKSEDQGIMWKSIVGNLPAESINVVREDPTDPNILYVGTDLGVFTSLDGGATWISLSASLPSTPVHDLFIHPRDNQIVIGTHGRGAFILEAGPIQEFQSIQAAGSPRFFEILPAILPNVEGKSVMSRSGTTYGEAKIGYMLPNSVSGVSIDIFDSSQTLVGRLTGSGEAGVHTLDWDLVSLGAEIQKGQYVDRQSYVGAGTYTLILKGGSDEVRGAVVILRQ
jgi:photosystem II stability/assembly factor-like uncharacterized protein